MFQIHVEYKYHLKTVFICLYALAVHFNEMEHQKKDNFQTTCSEKANILSNLDMFG